MSIGNMQPMGFTPLSLYRLATSLRSFSWSLAYFFWSSCIFGARVLIALVDCSCFRVRGNVSRRTMMVTTIMATPKLPEKTLDSRTRRFSVG